MRMANSTVSERVLLAGQYRGLPHGQGHSGLPHNLAVTARVTEGPSWRHPLCPADAKNCSKVVQRTCRAPDGTQGWVESQHDLWVSDQPWGSPALTMDFVASLHGHLSQVL